MSLQILIGLPSRRPSDADKAECLYAGPSGVAMRAAAASSTHAVHLFLNNPAGYYKNNPSAAANLGGSKTKAEVELKKKPPAKT